MAATDQTYRSLKTMHVVFGVSCVLMLFSVIWMLVQDYNREFKPIQRTFRDVEEQRNLRVMLEQLPRGEELDKAIKEASEARKKFEEAHAALRDTEKKLSGEREIKDVAYRTIKAEYDAKASYYDIAVDEAGKDADPKKHEGELKHKREELDKLRTQLSTAKRELDAAELNFREQVTEKLREPRETMEAAEDNLKRITGAFDRFAKTTAQKGWKVGDTIRALPILDGFASPVKPNQIVLEHLTIDYGGFRNVPRYDRCTSCHLGIDRPMFDKNALVALTQSPDELNKSLTAARRLLLRRVKAGEDLGFDPNDIPSKAESVKLTKGEITQYATHPRLDLFVDSNSPHSMEKFGCTICHGGQGSATSFTLSSHTPNDVHQTEEWKKNHDWKSIHHWDFPMLPNRFIEASCLQCHHQVTDLVRYGSKEEAPKLLKGYNLVKENGCFGCHEISGIKSGRPVGPDLRLEPTPALELQSAADQDKAKADTLNPPGTMRKVGPSLRRVAEKTNEEWTRKWIQSPRGFREDTKMPHFYGLANNKPEVLPEDQKKFPDAEIHAITHYIFAESRAQFKGDDTLRRYLTSTINAHQQALGQGPLSEKDRKELVEVSRAFANLALLSVPMRANDINTFSLEQRQLQERLQGLQKRKAEMEKREQEITDEDTKEITALSAALKKVTGLLLEMAKPVGVDQVVIDADGSVVPKEVLGKGDKDNGKKLFIERGCLACHAHQGTEPALIGEANFGPNLSRLAAKLGPDGGDELAKRRWLVQWLLNPNVHHTRTRMPVTFLKPTDASDIAEWLLGQKGEEYAEKDPTAPSNETLVDMARVYFGKAPGMTAKDVDTYLPKSDNADKLPPGIADNRKDFLPRDADEQALVTEKDGSVAREKLLWYIGKKSIGRLGCYGCHDMPGFETAKPIGTALNDWGKKDAERLAFEDSEAYLHEHYNTVEDRDDPKDKTKADRHWKAKDGKEPYEKYFAEALEHHHREGFLHLKLEQPRAFDHNRIRTWDDRLRMPQFQFSRPRRHKNESTDEYDSRKTREEAQAREAVMTFVLGLLAEPIPLKYVNSPPPDRAAEVRGRQVLEKYNCAGCHEVRPGVYEFKPSKDAIDRLEKSINLAVGNTDTDKSQPALKGDHYFPNHNAWVGIPSPWPDRMMAFGVGPKSEEAEREDNPEVRDKVLRLRLTDALRFTNNEKLTRDIPAASSIVLAERDLLSRSAPWGGTFVELLVGSQNEDGEWQGYLTSAGQYKGKPDDARSTLPPPLVREGERVQTKWLYQFLLNPTPIRPETHMKLRMPRFNMSAEESQALVNYFAAVSKTGNPALGLTYPYDAVPQREKQYWTQRSQEYVKKLNEKTLESRIKALEPVWLAQMKEQHAEMSALATDLKAAKKDEELALLEPRIKKLQEEIDKSDVSAMKENWKANDAYATDAYRLLTNKEICLKCHSIGNLRAEGAVGPPLDLTPDRLRPEWTLFWVAHPKRLFTYNTQMPQNFPNDKKQWQESFEGEPIEQIRAVRDALMDLPRLSAMPANRKTPVGGK